VGDSVKLVDRECFTGSKKFGEADLTIGCQGGARAEGCAVSRNGGRKECVMERCITNQKTLSINVKRLVELFDSWL
jgi:hypothetical protein